MNALREKSRPLNEAYSEANKAENEAEMKRILKEFDKVNHWFLFEKLLLSGLPVPIVRLLVYWYSSQNFFVSWSGVLSSAFKVTNGVRQGRKSVLNFV